MLLLRVDTRTYIPSTKYVEPDLLDRIKRIFVKVRLLSRLRQSAIVVRVCFLYFCVPSIQTQHVDRITISLLETEQIARLS